MLFLLGCVVAPATAQAAAQDDARTVTGLIQDADDLLTKLEARRGVAPGDPDLNKVKTITRELGTLAPGNSQLIFLDARYMVLTGLTGDASDKLLEFVDTRQGETEWRAFRLLGDSFLDEFPRLARSNYKKAAELNPGEAGVLFGLSVCELRLGAVAGAVQLARDAVKVDGRKTIRYVAHLARALQAAKEWDGALREGENALKMARRETERDTTSKPALPGSKLAPPVSRWAVESLNDQYTLVMSILRARIAARFGDSANDFLRFDTCVRQQSRVSAKLRLHDWLGVVESHVKSSEADTLVKPACRSVALLQLYGRLLRDVGRTEDAIGTFERIEKLDPDNTEAESARNSLRKIAPSRP